ncbi:MAG: hypothetical protein HYR55_07100 [Acidobacteria bacterium]|nr:hypothetical protein [Acidobacteriota bacterium]MBI3656214.1 hypothetical protein [Acidobacteriota bacterium]
MKIATTRWERPDYRRGKRGRGPRRDSPVGMPALPGIFREDSYRSRIAVAYAP